MNTKAFEQFDVTNEVELSSIEGGFWRELLAGAIGAIDGGGVTLEQLNGIKLPKPCSCSPYGVGGTPNFCNF
ncbi:MAG: ComC/BlpC family peptide pheromone/bacteriocin [Streptococcus orisratti]|uniref:ComC/BlpC family peptide pheromone/bacteriocin n=1 Tax=Streptococcus TaxID=1301 RepID=UPI0023558CF0|nr:ComC/BlpC family peptide pheromone/bacteriocin [Streptococcus orisratti]MCI7678302.1 ComC/BlpC family peptide pheromone/bacteriocin [Streptococcus orisratti]MDY4000956.1 ComC/BlpC family peptide pheromone/bacteriocin [Streptococcus orisratti]MDY5635204.1 ComC/BlpC family peptide pheromone/bacteriocin [Streptococcus orisratti]